MSLLKLSGADSVGRQPEGAKKWFAESRARRALMGAGLTLSESGEKGYCVDIKRKDELLGCYCRAPVGGLSFYLNVFVPELEETAYKFGRNVVSNYGKN